MKDIMRDPRINNYNFFSKAGMSSSFSGPLTGDAIEDTHAMVLSKQLKEGLLGKGSFQKRPQIYTNAPKSRCEVSEHGPSTS